MANARGQEPIGKYIGQKRHSLGLRATLNY